LVSGGLPRRHWSVEDAECLKITDTCPDNKELVEMVVFLRKLHELRIIKTRVEQKKNHEITSVTPDAGLIFETKNRAIFL